METVDLTTLNLLTFTDFMLLLFWLVSVVFASYIMSHLANSIVRFIASFTRSYRFKDKYDKDYNLQFAPKKLTPTIKGVKSNHGRRIPFINKR